MQRHSKQCTPRVTRHSCVDTCLLILLLLLLLLLLLSLLLCITVLCYRLAKLKPVFAKDGVVTAGNRYKFDYCLLNSV
jgi:hypothetical protein